MKHFTMLFAFVFSFGVMAPAVAQDMPVVAIVDILALQNDSKAAKDIKKQVESINKKYESEFKGKEKSLKDAEKDLAKAKENLPEAEFIEKAKEFQKKVIKANQDMQKRQRELDSAVGDALNELRGEIVKVVGDLASEKEYGLVLPRQSVFYFEKSLNITDDVMKRLNANVKTIKIDAK